MRKKEMILRTMLLLALLVIAPAAKAHSPLVATMPADGAVLAVAPDTLQLTFKGTARLARLLLSRDGSDITLGKDHLMQKATQHNVPLPALADGRYQVRWRALSADGHIINGTFAFTVGN